MYWRSFDKCLISITCYAPSHMLQKQGVTAARQKSPGDPVPSVLSSGCPLEVTSHFWKFRAFCWKLQLHFCDYMKKGVGFQIFFSPWISSKPSWLLNKHLCPISYSFSDGWVHCGGWTISPWSHVSPRLLGHEGLLGCDNLSHSQSILCGRSDKCPGIGDTFL